MNKFDYIRGASQIWEVIGRQEMRSAGRKVRTTQEMNVKIQIAQVLTTSHRHLGRSALHRLQDEKWRG